MKEDFFEICNLTYENKFEALAFRGRNGKIVPRNLIEPFIKGLKKFYDSHTEEDIERLNEKFLKSKEESKEKEEKDPLETKSEVKEIETQPSKPGYVYFIQEKLSNTIKIGKTVNLENRMNIFSVKLPFEWEYVETYLSHNVNRLETAIHRHFRDKRVNGEWFALDIDDINVIKSKQWPEEIMELIKETA